MMQTLRSFFDEKSYLPIVKHQVWMKWGHQHHPRVLYPSRMRTGVLMLKVGVSACLCSFSHIGFSFLQIFCKDLNKFCYFTLSLKTNLKLWVQIFLTLFRHEVLMIFLLITHLELTTAQFLKCIYACYMSFYRKWLGFNTNMCCYLFVYFNKCEV